MTGFTYESCKGLFDNPIYIFVILFIYRALNNSITPILFTSLNPKLSLNVFRDFIVERI